MGFVPYIGTPYVFFKLSMPIFLVHASSCHCLREEMCCGHKARTCEQRIHVLLSAGKGEDMRRHLLGNGPNTVSGSTVSNTELSEFFGAH